jgi:small-conductance mechanosensitive channel
MSDLVTLLLHPDDWSDYEDMSSHQRLVLSLLVGVLTVVVAALAGYLSGRWARARAAGVAEGQDEGWLVRVRRLRRGLVLLVLCAGAELAVEVAPLSRRNEAALGRVLFVVIALAVARVVLHLFALTSAAWVRRLPDAERKHVERDFLPLASKVLGSAVFLVLVIAVAKRFGKDLSSLVAALGVGSLAIGLAAQQTLGNMIAGFVLLVDRPFRPGDRVRLASGEVGEVREVGVRSTRVQLSDGNLLIVPNAELVSARVVNLRAVSLAGELKLLLRHDVDPEVVAQLLTEVVAAEQAILPEPIPTVRLSGTNDLGLEFTANFSVAPPQAALLAAEDRLRRAALVRLRAAGLELARRPGP